MLLKTLSLAHWIIAALIAVVVLIIGLIDGFILLALMDGSTEWEYVGDGAKAFLISTLGVLGAITIGVICLPLIYRIRALEERLRTEDGKGANND